MTDKREQILDRLRIVAESVFGGEKFVWRNAKDIPEDKRPACVILDADETQEQRFDATGRGRPANAPVIMTLQPEIIIAVQDQAEKLGPAINAQRALFLKAVLTDATLVGLCTEIRYDGLTNSLGLGRQMNGLAHLHISFFYHLRIDQL